METPLWDYDALLFDLDGVITRTATVHAAAWKRLFDDYLAGLEEPHEPLRLPEDYLRHIDGRRRYDGVDGFLRSRGIELPWGDPSDPPGDQTVCALGNKKNEYFAAELAEHGVEVFEDSVALLREARRRGRRIAVVSASENCRDILARAGLLDCFDAFMTGIEAGRLGVPGKPAPDTFLKAAEMLDTPPARAVVLEDAISGVQAGRAGSFGLVVGVDRGAGADLKGNGADIVCTDLTRLI